MNKKYILIIALVVLVVISGVNFYKKITAKTYPSSTYPSSFNFDFYSIHDLKQNSFTSGTYNTEGYVVYKYTCGFCLPPTECKPCQKDFIIISENKNEPKYTYDNEGLVGEATRRKLNEISNEQFTKDMAFGFRDSEVVRLQQLFIQLGYLSSGSDNGIYDEPTQTAVKQFQCDQGITVCSEKRLYIFVNNPRQFELGKKYRFSIKILPRDTTLEPMNDVELIGYDLIK